MSFPQELRKELSDNCREREFSQYDFSSIAKKYNRSDRQTGEVLRRFKDSGLIYIVGKLSTVNGGEPAKIYRIVEGADFQVKTATQRANDWRVEKKIKSSAINDCANRLQNVMDGWARK